MTTKYDWHIETPPGDRGDVRVEPLCNPTCVYYACFVREGTRWSEAFDCIVTRVSDGLPGEQRPLVIVLPNEGPDSLAVYEAPQGSSDEEAIRDAVRRYLVDHPEALRSRWPS